MKKVLTLAGSDASGGAGIEADLKTFQVKGLYGMAAVTTIATMDPDNHWEHNVFPQTIEAVEAQLKTILSTGIDAMKTGMLGSPDMIQLAADVIDKHQLKNVVIDPVMVCKGTDEVLNPENKDALRDVLVKRATVTTPNLFEAAQLAGHRPITTVEGMKEAARAIHDLGCANVLIKGGSDLEGSKTVDLLYDGHEFTTYEAEKIEGLNTHGAGCTHSAAITAELAKGKTVKEAVESTKAFITEAIKNGFALNQYVGPVNQFEAYRKLEA